MDIYAANESPIDNISSETILQEVKKYKVNAVLINEEKELAEYLNKTIKNNDILLTIGAGNISKFVNYYKKIVT
jgi:UDP-N-acetylmuramate--alanine ligase